jgi:dTDP-4-amino-4,6-dideoxygalactose transaminase
LKRSYHSIGYNSRLDELHAAVLRVKLKQVDAWSELRRKHASEYNTLLANSRLILPYTPPGYEHVYHLYVIECDDRDDLQAYLASRGIVALTHYPIAIHQQEGFPWGRGARVVDSLTVTEQSAARVLSLPMYPELTRPELQYTAEAIQSWAESHDTMVRGAR